MKMKISHHPDLPALSRRSFLRAALVTGGALALPGCGVSSPPNASIPACISGPLPMATSTLPSSPPPEYLPRIDGSLTAVALPAPRVDGGIPLMQALARRASRRVYGPDEIPVQVLSDLLWAAFGVNRPSGGLRTAPSAVNVQDIEIFIVTAKGMFRFDARPHVLQAVLPDDLRSLTGVQASAGPSPVSLVYVSDYEKIRSLNYRGLGADSDAVWSWTHTGFISQNVYLFCASEGLATVVRAIFDRESLTERMGMNDSMHITLVQTVGYLV